MNPRLSDSKAGIPLSAEERAEKIFRDYNFGHAATLTQEAKQYISEIAWEIKQAEQSVFERTRERAAKLADEMSKDEYKDQFRQHEARKIAFKVRALSLEDLSTHD